MSTPILSAFEPDAQKRHLLELIARDKERRKLVGQRPISIQDIEEVQAEQQRFRNLEWLRALECHFGEDREQAQAAPNQTKVDEVLKMPSEKITLLPSEMIQRSGGKWQRVNKQTIEERLFQVALIYMESYLTQLPPMGLKTATKSREAIKTTLEKTLNSSQVREVLAKNVDIWLRIKAILVAVVPTLATRSVREAYAETLLPGVDIPESSTLMAENHESLLEDLTTINNLLVIARNMLAIKEVAQDICAATQLNKQVIKLMVVCVNVTSKGYDGENIDPKTRQHVVEIAEIYKKVLVTCLQFLHNLTMGNDRLKMAFWFEMLFDNDLHEEPIQDPAPQLRVDVVYEEVRHWLKRNNTQAPMAEVLLEKHTADVRLGNTGGSLPIDELLTPFNAETNTYNKGSESSTEASYVPPQTIPVWSENATSKEEKDRLYGRVSHEIDVWWKRVRDANYEGWVVAMETVEGAISKAQQSKDNAMTRYVPRRDDPDVDSDFFQKVHYIGSADVDNKSLAADEADEEAEDEENDEDEDEDEDGEDDDDSYVDGPLRGLLTEIPNILDTKQIEALHMTVKACIVDAMGSGLTKAGENLQKTRCKMFLALDCGKNLLREMLVFIAVWEQAESQFIFQITAQIIESFHHNALLPYAWNSLKILKDIVSPAQTVLLRLINYMFRARKNTTIYTDNKDYERDAKLIHFLYRYFRCNVVPDCVALIHAQAQIRNNKKNAMDFPVDLWDMERAKDGLSQYLDFISVIADIPEMRPLLIKWETVYELIALLNTLEDGIARKPLVESKKAAPEPTRNTASAGTDATISDEDLESGSSARKNSTDHSYPSPSFSTIVQAPSSARDPALPALHDSPHKFPWSGIKVQILIILTSLVAPASGVRGPGNPTVQKQIVKHGGITALLNCCVYDGNNEYLKERATLCIKFVMDGCEEAQQFVRELSPLNKNPKQEQIPLRTRTQSLVSPVTPPRGSTGSAPTASPSSSSTYDTAPTKSQVDDSSETSNTATAIQGIDTS